MNLTDKELQTLQNICTVWQEQYEVTLDTNTMLGIAMRIKNKMVKAAPSMSLHDLQEGMKDSEFIGKLVNKLNDELVQEEKLLKETKEKFLANLK